MSFVLAPASFPKAPSLTSGRSSMNSKQYAKNYYASSHVTTLWHKTGIIQKEPCFRKAWPQNLKLHCKVKDGGSRCEERKRNYVMNATSEKSNEYEIQDQKNSWGSFINALHVFFKFIRPTATFSLLLGATLNTLIAVEKLSDLSPAYFIGLLQVLVVSTCMQIFMAGLNQLYDVEIDKINKPYLPLVSGELSFNNGVIIVASSFILGHLFPWIIGSWPLFWSFVFSSSLAIAYCADLPLLRWKRYSALTALNYIIDLAGVKPLGYVLHMQTYVFKRPVTFSRPLIFCMAMSSVFAIIIAIFKDIPDMEGDEKFGIKSLSLHLGQKRVFWICVSLLQMAYGVAIMMGALSPFLSVKIVMGLGHSILASLVWYHAKSVDLKSNPAIQSFYTFIWKLLTVEYFLIPFFR
ncbi:PREDICTED: naringenin 8-dimethylallyltransferase 2, chloroplastic-like [Lupinus angustifolius]|uniref:naringenin 8-dimethylallyltransferase 2, chloroplastic-like n=1 Tax=Lupinus angustifolius TaxID=3871 RepID=UPI00092F5675|nr:PREDICTED: naringenin 8-dimethylallyltransferase 2, chloroplastic-like [Lupinus angustifolius]